MRETIQKIKDVMINNGGFYVVEENLEYLDEYAEVLEELEKAESTMMCVEILKGESVYKVVRLKISTELSSKILEMAIDDVKKRKTALQKKLYTVASDVYNLAKGFVEDENE